MFTAWGFIGAASGGVAGGALGFFCGGVGAAPGAEVGAVLGGIVGVAIGGWAGTNHEINVAWNLYYAEVDEAAAAYNQAILDCMESHHIPVPD